MLLLLLIKEISGDPPRILACNTHGAHPEIFSQQASSGLLMSRLSRYSIQECSAAGL
jgi:hypothetical protein